MPEEHFPLIGRSLYRDVNAETVYLPHHVKADNTKPSVALRSEPSGNCLYSSASLALVGSNALIHTLRAMVSIELFIYANYYCYHPIFTSTLEKHGDKVSVSAKNVLAMSCCFESVDSGLSGLDLVKMEALCNCRDKIWGSFLCILALSSVTNRIISLMYPDCGEVSFKLLFNQIISPRLPLPTPPTQYNYLYLLFCSTTLLTSSKVFKTNHFAPLIFKPISKTKRKASALLEKANKKIPHVKRESSTVNISNFFQPVSTPASNKAKQFILPKLFSTTQTQSTQKVPAITSLGLIHNPKQELLQSFSLDFHSNIQMM
ncbi:uncharacterized protein LOC124450591 [Xenia sp. Carnegie-2017]|uniref:uncharacterized protein LOC124450591 n=1 Tax=Xenia sp. Carnegie-2017 TaxID=2897299 RepID=UPI001F03FCD4|nr:uncharacterized protein LOC124450591 [Xenia sp. Carnegie-2017]